MGGGILIARLDLGGIGVRITHPDRVLWPATAEYPAIRKRDLLKYFVDIWEYIQPHLRDRPLTLKRYPTGLNGKHFFQKHVEFELPEFVTRACLYAEEHDSSGYYVICNNLETLLWLGQIADLELHTWYSRTNPEPDAHGLPQTFSGSLKALEASVLNYPDFMVFDVDPYLYSGAEQPGDEPLLHPEGFARACQAARWLKETLDQLGLTSYVKTSGKTGLHICVPIVRQFDYDTVRRLSEQICRFVLRRHPAELTMEWSVERRRGKVFLDHNQNTRGKTLATAYSPRALPGAPVSMPVRWSELDHIHPTQFMLLTTALPRMRREGDVWQDILERKNDLSGLLDGPPRRTRNRAPSS